MNNRDESEIERLLRECAKLQRENDDKNDLLRVIKLDLSMRAVDSEVDLSSFIWERLERSVNDK